MFARRGLNGFLVPLQVRPADLALTLPRLAAIGNIRGIIVTIPHKEAVARLCHELGENAKLIGAVNTVRVTDDGRLIGEMFDGVGVLATARSQDMNPRDRAVLMVGAGGAGRAIGFAMAAAGARKIGIANRTASRAERLVADINAAFPTRPATLARADASGYELVINCTSLGLRPGDAMPLPPATLQAHIDVIDIIAVRETELMAAAGARGCRVIGGRPMIELQFDAQLMFIGQPPALDG